MFLKLIIVSLSFMQLGCSKGPDSNSIKQTMQQRLDTKFGENTFQVKQLSRRGSYSYSSGSDKLLVYFKAEVEVKKSVTLSDTTQLNAASFVNELGATSTGVKGIKSSGNAPGDIINIFGTSHYEWRDNNWSATIPFLATGESGGLKTKAKFVSEIDAVEKINTANLPQLEKDVRQLSRISKYLISNDRKEFAFELHLLLQKSIRMVNLHLARTNDWTLLATGAASGTYYALGTGLAAIKEGQPFRNISTSGSVENIGYLEGKDVDFAIVQSDVAANAYLASGLFSKKVSNLRAVTSLFPEAVHIVVSEDSEISSPQDLAGKRVNIGPEGSGSRSNALQVLDAAGIEVSELTVSEKHTEWAIQKIMAGELDAFFYTGPYPSRNLQAVLSGDKFFLLSLGEEIRRKLTASGSYLDIVLPEKTYGIGASVNTVGVMALMVGHEKVKAERVKALLERIYNNKDKLGLATAQANLIDRKNWKKGAAIPFHEAAVKYFEAN